MKKQKLLLLITIIVSILTGCGGAEERKAKYLDKANKYYIATNYEKARLEFKNSLQISPDDIDARLGLAKTLEKLKLRTQAAGNYLKIIQLDPNNVDARVNIARYYLTARVFTRAETVLDEAIKLSPNNSSAIALKGTLQAVKGKKELAFKDAKNALAIEPSNLDAISLMSGLYIANNDSEKALEVLKSGIKLNPSNSELIMITAGIYAERGQNGRAIELLQDVITLNPDKLEYRLQLSRFYDAKKATSESIRILKTAVNELEEKEKPILALTDYIARRISKDEAESELSSYIKKYPELYELQLGLARLYYGQKKLKETKDIYLDIIREQGISKYALISRSQLAQIYIQENSIDMAKKEISEVLNENSQDTSALILRGTISLSKNKLVDAIADFRTVLRNQPNHPVVSKLLAQAYIANNEIELANELYVRAINVSPKNTKLRIELAQLLIDKGELNKAISELQQAAKISPKDMAVLEALYQVYIANNNMEAAIEVTKAIKEVDMKSPNGFYAAGMAYKEQKKYALSDKEFMQSLSLAKGSVKIISAITKNYLAQNKYVKAEKFLSKQIKLAPKSVISKNLLGEVYLIQKKFKLAKKLFISVESQKPEWDIPYRNLASIYLMQKDTESAINVFIRGKKASKNNPNLSYSLASLYEQIGKPDFAIKEFEEILSYSPNSLAASNNLAMMLVSYRNDEKSISKAYALVDKLKQSNNPNYLDTLGWVLVKSDKSKAAVNYLEKAAKQIPDSGIVQYHLGAALFKSGDILKAKIALQKAVQSKQKFKGKDEAEVMLNKIETQKS